MKHQVVQTLQKYVNPPIKLALAPGLPLPDYALLETKGRKTGKPRGLRIGLHNGTAHLLPDDDPRERQRWRANQLPFSAGNARAVRLFGTQLLSIRIDLDS
jgi:hypothetical protein